MIGNSPKVAPSVADSSVCPTGMPYTISATSIATPSDASAAHWAFQRTPPSRTNRHISGSAAKIELSPSELETGSKSCVYTSALPHRSLWRSFAPDTTAGNG